MSIIRCPFFFFNMDIIQEIYNIFVEYYKEPYVDLQPSGDNYLIKVYWPEVTVTNELGQSEIIWGLYSQIELTSEGKLKGRMHFLRSEYNQAQWKAGYVHSHISPMYNGDSVTEWRSCCTGTGPINGTIDKLMGMKGGEFWKDHNMWMLFCWELDKYVHVESLEGGPYQKLSDLDSKERPIQIPVVNTIIKATTRKLLNPFILYVVKKKVLKYSFYDGSYHIGMSSRDLILTLSNLFIDWFNHVCTQEVRDTNLLHQLETDEIVQKMALGSYGAISYGSGRTNTTVSLESKLGTEVLIFKDQHIVLTENLGNSNTHYYLLLTPKAVGYIIYKILNHINIYYGKESITGKASNNDDNLSTETCTTAHKTECIL